MKILFGKRILLIVFAGLFVSLSGGCRVPGLGERDDSPKAVRTLEYSSGDSDLNASPKPDHVALASQLMERGYFDVALVQLREAEVSNDNAAQVHYLRGVCHRKEGRLAEADASFRKAIRHDSGMAAAYDGLGLVLWADGRKEDARKACARAVALNPGSADFQNNLGYCHMHAGAYEEAGRCFRKSLTLDGMNRRALHNLGTCLVLAGREKEAYRELTRALPPGQAYNDMGVACEQAGHNERAIAYYRKALAVSPSLKQARQNMERVEKAQDTMHGRHEPAMAEILEIPAMPPEESAEQSIHESEAINPRKERTSNDEER